MQQKRLTHLKIERDYSQPRTQSELMIPFPCGSIISCPSNKWAPTFFKVASYKFFLFQFTENDLRERIPVPRDISFKIYLKFARVLRRLFLSVVSVTRAVYFHVNMTCFAAKHLKFDSHYSNQRQEPILIGSCC